MNRNVIIWGLAIAAVGPVVVAIGTQSANAAPGCTWAFSAPAGGCEIGGVSFNWFIALASLAFANSFVLVLLGVLVAAGGFIALLVGKQAPVGAGFQRRHQPIGLCDQSGRQLSPVEVVNAIARSERAQLNDILRSFGHPLSAKNEPIGAYVLAVSKY